MDIEQGLKHSFESVESDINHFVGKKLKEVRKKRNLSQAEIAELLGCSHQLIQKQECGEARIQVDFLYRLSNILRVSPNYFYEGYQPHYSEVKEIPSGKQVIKERIKKEWDILLIEDNPEDEFIFHKVLEQVNLPYDFKVHTCYNGVEAFKYLQGASSGNVTLPDIIFLDLNLPKKSGFSVLNDLKKDASLMYIPIIVLTNSVNALEMLESYKLYSSGYVCKSFDINIFKDKIERILDYWMNTVVTPKNY